MRGRDGSGDALAKASRLVARLLTDPPYARAVAARPGPLLAAADLPRQARQRLAGVPPEGWAQEAARFVLTPGRPRRPRARPPRPEDFPRLPRRPDGRIFAEGRKRDPRRGHRTVSLRATLRRARAVEQLVGITRISDVTGVDFVGIPTWAAIRPENRDTISVLNGKGRSALEARAGAYMEAVERHAAESRPRDVVVASSDAMRRGGPVVLPTEVRLAPPEVFDLDSPVEWTRAWDLLGETWVWVPVAAVVFPYQAPRGVTHFASDTIGLASGNTLEEAVFHALAERIERDADSLVATAGCVSPLARALGRELLGERFRGRTLPSNRFPEHLDLATVPAPLRELVDRFEAAHLELSVLDLTSDHGIPAFRASVVDPDPSLTALSLTFGLGAHPTKEVALARALTEVAQCRAAIVQGARDDLPALLEVKGFGPDYPLAERGRRHWRDVPTLRSPLVRDDVRVLLAAVTRAGARRCLVKELTRPEVRLPVVRVLVPELEDWSTLALHDAPRGLGSRALESV